MPNDEYLMEVINSYKQSSFFQGMKIEHLMS